MPHPDEMSVIRRCLDEKAELINRDLPPPHDYRSLQMTVIHQELYDEIEALRTMFTRGDFEGHFKARCHERAIKNMDTCLSFTAMPHGACNELYWTITTILFHPVTMQEMLAILLPDVTQYVRQGVTVTELSKPASLSNTQFVLEETSLADLGPAELDAFSRYVIAGHCLMDVKDITIFDLPMHRRYQTMLSTSAPELARRLYQHNPDLKRLSEHLSMFKGKGRTPLEVLSSLIQALCLGGSSMTGATYASEAAEKAFESFQEYMRFLSTEIRERLLPLRGTYGLSLGGVIEHLENRNCVEVASIHLESIIDLASNRTILSIHPTFHDTFLANIKKHYQRQLGCPVEIISKNPSEDDKREIIDKKKILLMIRKEGIQICYCSELGTYCQRTVDSDILLTRFRKDVTIQSEDPTESDKKSIMDGKVLLFIIREGVFQICYRTQVGEYLRDDKTKEYVLADEYIQADVEAPGLLSLCKTYLSGHLIPRSTEARDFVKNLILETNIHLRSSKAGIHLYQAGERVEEPKDLFIINAYLLSLGISTYHSISPHAIESTTVLPTVGLERAISSINLFSTQDYINQLITFPPMLYAALIQYANMGDPIRLPESLTQSLIQGILNEEQKLAFLKALLSNRDKFERGAVITFITRCDRLGVFLSSMSREEQLYVLASIRLSSAEDYISQLTALPLALYADLIRHAEIVLLPWPLIQMVKDGRLNEEQKLAFLKALLSNRDKFERGAVITFITRCDRLGVFLSSMSREDLLYVLASIRLSSAEDYISQLTALPFALYADLIRHAQIVLLPESLVQMIKDGRLNEEQKIAFLKALLSNRDKFERGAVITFITRCDRLGLLLPSISREELLYVVASIRLSSAEDYISQLTALPLALYADLIRHARIVLLPESLVQMIKDGRLNEEQKLAFLKALLSNQSQLRMSVVIAFIDHCDMLLPLLPFIPAEAIFINKDGIRDELFSKALVRGNLILFRAVLELLPAGDRFLAIKKEGIYNSCLQSALSAPQLLQIIWELLPAEDRLLAMKEKYEGGYSLLTRASLCSGSFRIILDSFSEAARFDILKESGLKYLIHQPDLLKIILELLPLKDRFLYIKEKDISGDRIIDSMTFNPKSLQVILELLPAADWLLAMEERNSRGSSLFECSCLVPESFRILLGSYPEGDRFNILKENKLLRAPLSDGPRPLQIIKIILELLPEADCLKALKYKDIEGRSLLDSTPTAPELLTVILDKVTALQAIQSMTAIAQIKYKQWFTGTQIYRGENGFFTSMRHGIHGQLRAEILERAISTATCIEDAIAIINDCLRDPKTRYHQHSFAAFLLDELKILSDTPWTQFQDGYKDKHYDKNSVIWSL